MQSENPPYNYEKNRKNERLQSRRDNFLKALKNVCNREADTCSYKRITGFDNNKEENWVEFRFCPLKDDENLPDYEFHRFVDKLIAELNSDEYFITWYEHPNMGLVIKVEIDGS